MRIKDNRLDLLEESLEFAGLKANELINDYLCYVGKTVRRPFGNRTRLLLLEELLNFTDFNPVKIINEYKKDHRPPEDEMAILDNRLFDDCTPEQVEKLKYYNTLRE